MLQETLKAKLIHTDDRREMERIGEEIVNAMPSRYDARTMDLMKAAVAKSMPDLLGDEADRYLKRTVYGYWVYGVTTKEWFYYDFENKTDEEKCEYIGFMDRFSYLRHLNNLELGQKVLDDLFVTGIGLFAAEAMNTEVIRIIKTSLVPGIDSSVPKDFL